VQYVEQVMRGLSSQVERLYPAEAFVSLGGERRKAMADQITTASKRRLLGALGLRHSHNSLAAMTTL